MIVPDPVRIQKVTEVALSAITVETRQRPLSEAGVAALVASIESEGLQNPIVLRQVPKKGAREAHLVLISGLHRVEAARRLDWATIPATAYECSAAQARAMEIDENLVRRELPPLDLSVGLSERKELHEQLHPETRAGVFKGNRHTGSLATDIMSVTRTSGTEATDMMSVAGFAAIAAENLGVSERHVRRLIAAGVAIRALGVEKFRACPTPHGVTDLIAFSRLDADRQAAVAKLLADRGATIPGAIAALGDADGAPKEVSGAMTAFSRVWTRTSRAERRAIVAENREEFRAILDELDAEASAA